MADLSDKEQLLIIRWLNNELSTEELEAFESSKDFGTYKNIIRELDTWEIAELDIKESFGKLNEKRGNVDKKGKVISMSPNYLKIGLAASVLIMSIILIYTLFLKSDITTYKTLVGQIKTIELPGGSTVYLNALSEVSYKEKNWDSLRAIKLRGNAYFDVKKGNPFVVTSSQGKVVVKGTEFEINDNQEYYTVQCLEGSVQVAIKGNEIYLLDSGQAVSYTKRKKPHKFNVSRTKSPSWSGNKNKFTNAPLSQVFDAMKGVFNIEFEFKNIDLEKKFTGEFLHSDVEIALKMVCIPMRIEYVISDNKITLKAKK